MRQHLEVTRAAGPAQGQGGASAGGRAPRASTSAGRRGGGAPACVEGAGAGQLCGLAAQVGIHIMVEPAPWGHTAARLGSVEVRSQPLWCTGCTAAPQGAASRCDDGGGALASPAPVAKGAPAQRKRRAQLGAAEPLLRPLLQPGEGGQEGRANQRLGIDHAAFSCPPACPEQPAAPHIRPPRTFLAFFLDLDCTSRCRWPSPAVAPAAASAAAAAGAGCPCPTAAAAAPIWPPVTAPTCTWQVVARRNSAFTGASPRAACSSGLSCGRASWAAGAAAAAAGPAWVPASSVAILPKLCCLMTSSRRSRGAESYSGWG